MFPCVLNLLQNVFYIEAKTFLSIGSELFKGGGRARQTTSQEDPLKHATMSELQPISEEMLLASQQTFSLNLLPERRHLPALSKIFIGIQYKHIYFENIFLNTLQFFCNCLRATIIQHS